MEEKLKKENKINAVNLLVCLSLSETITFYILQFLKFVIKIIESKIAKKSIIPDIIRIDDNYSIYSNISTAIVFYICTKKFPLYKEDENVKDEVKNQ